MLKGIYGRPSIVASHNFLAFMHVPVYQKKRGRHVWVCVVQEGWYLFLLPSLPPALGKSTWHIGDSELKWLQISRDLQTNRSLFSRQSKEGTELHMERMTRQSSLRKKLRNSSQARTSRMQCAPRIYVIENANHLHNYHARRAILQLGG